MDQQNNASARDVLQRAIRAKGGAESLRGVHTLLATGTLTVRSPRPLQGRTTIYVRYPDSFRVDAALPNGDVTQVYAAGQTWMKDPSGVHDVDRQEGERLRNNAARDLVSLLLKAADGKVQVRLLPEERGTGAAAVDTLQLSGDGMPPVDLLVDRSTGMIAAERYFVEQPGAIGKVPTEEWYSDYRAVDGIKVAFKTVVRRGEAVILERTLTDLKINVPIEDGTFKRPI